MTPNDVDYIATVLAELIKLAEQDEGRQSDASMLTYLMSLAHAEADDLRWRSTAAGEKSDRYALGAAFG